MRHLAAFFFVLLIAFAGTARTRPVAPAKAPAQSKTLIIKRDAEMKGKGRECIEVQWSDGIATYIWREASDPVIVVEARLNNAGSYFPLRLTKWDRTNGGVLVWQREYTKEVKGEAK